MAFFLQFTEMYTLSINFGHDASLALFKITKLLDFQEIERTSRFKHHVGIKSIYIDKFLERNKLKINDITSIAVTGTQYWSFHHCNNIKINFNITKKHENILNSLKIENFENHQKKDPTFFVKGKQIGGAKFKNQIDLQKLDSFTEYPVKYNFSNSFIDGNEVVEEKINDLFQIYKKKYLDKNYFVEEFYIPLTFKIYDNEIPGFFINHHAAHAAHAAMYTKSSSIIVTHDGGSNEVPFNSGGIYFYDTDLGLFPINSHNFLFGTLYDNIGNIFGLTPGKLMGLSSFGNPSVLLNKIENFVLDVFNCLPNERNKNKEKLVDAIINISKNDQSIKSKYVQKFNFDFEDVNFAIQCAANTQSIVQNLFTQYISRVVPIIQNNYEVKDLFITGGFTLNCPTNSNLSKLLPSINLKPLPACGDTGLSLGAGKLVNDIIYDKAVRNFEDFETSAFPKSNLSNPFVSHSHDLNDIKVDMNLIHLNLSRLLINKKIICINRNSSEIGPRALGRRSIIAIASSEEIRDKINNAKGRENWRPLAPICCDIDYNNFFDGDVDESIFMLFTNKVKSNKLKGITHIDNTARVQSLKNKHDWLYKTIQQLKKYNEPPVIINTSFNCSEEPIVENLNQSIRSFKKMDFDFLLYNERLLFKKINSNLVEMFFQKDNDNIKQCKMQKVIA